MVEGQKLEHAGVLERAAHQLVVLDAMAVVGERDDAGPGHRADGRELLALDALVMQPVVKTLTQASRSRAFPHQRDGVRAVRGRGGVRHADHAGEAARRRRARAGGDGLLRRLPGSRKWTWISISPGATTRPRQSISSNVPGTADEMRPSTMARSPISSRLFAGSMMRPLRRTREGMARAF